MNELAQCSQRPQVWLFPTQREKYRFGHLWVNQTTNGHEPPENAEIMASQRLTERKNPLPIFECFGTGQGRPRQTVFARRQYSRLQLSNLFDANSIFPGSSTVPIADTVPGLQGRLFCLGMFDMPESDRLAGLKRFQLQKKSVHPAAVTSERSRHEGFKNSVEPVCAHVIGAVVKPQRCSHLPVL